MGYIIKNGTNYFGDNSVSLTQAQYDALPSSKLTDGVNYFITDGDSSGEPSEYREVIDDFTHGGKYTFTRCGHMVTVQGRYIGTVSSFSTVGVVTLVSNINPIFLPQSDDIYIAGFRSNGYTADHFQGYRLREASNRTLISYVYSNKPIDNGNFIISYLV